MHICVGISQTKRQGVPEVVIKNRGMDWVLCIRNSQGAIPQINLRPDDAL